jgi:hypothetical protein
LSSYRSSVASACGNYRIPGDNNATYARKCFADIPKRLLMSGQLSDPCRRQHLRTLPRRLRNGPIDGRILQRRHRDLQQRNLARSRHSRLSHLATLHRVHAWDDERDPVESNPLLGRLLRDVPKCTATVRVCFHLVQPHSARHVRLVYTRDARRVKRDDECIVCDHGSEHHHYRECDLPESRCAIFHHRL